MEHRAYEVPRICEQGWAWEGGQVCVCVGAGVVVVAEQSVSITMDLQYS